MNPTRIAVLRLSAVALTLVVSLILTAPAVLASGHDGCPIVVSGGTSTSETNIDISVNGGTAIADAAGGSNNVATTGATGIAGVASAGNGGTATALANGGSVSIGNVNSGGNTGNVVTVTCPKAVPMKPVVKKPVMVKKAPAVPPARLPSAGVGVDVVRGNTGGSALLLASAALLTAGAAGAALRRRFR